MIYLLL